MKLTDDKKTKEDNGILFENSKDIESVSTELKRVVPKEEEEKEVGSKGKIKMDTIGMSRKYAKDRVMVNGKKIKEEENKNNFNMDVKEQEKNIKSITEDLEKLGIDNGAIDNRKLATATPKKMERQRRVELNGASRSLGETGSVNVEMIKGSADKTRSVEDITAIMGKLGLGSGMRVKDKDLAKRDQFDMKAFLRDLSAEQVESDEERLASVNLKTVEIVAQSEKKGEENEDFEETRVVSDAYDYQSDENRCSSYVGRGPFNGVAKDTEHHDLKEMLKMSDSHYSDCSQPRKYSRPPMMSGGCVQVVQPDAHVRSLYNVRHLEDLNISPQYPGQMPDSFLCHLNSEVSAEQGIHPYCNSDLKNYNGCQVMQHCPPFYDPRDPVYPPAEDFSGGLEHGSNPAYLDHELLGNYTTFDADQGMGGMPCNPLHYYQYQMGSPNVPFPSAHSPYDHCLTSPGSSPPSVLSYPLSPTSTILTNGDPDLGDLSMLSPGQFSLSSPESGFMTDASRDLDDALEFIEEEMAASFRRAPGKSASLLPVVVEDLGSDLACEAFVSTGGPLQSPGNVPQPTKPRKPRGQSKKDTKRSPKVTQSASVPDMASRILPPVNGRVPCTTFYAPSGLSATQLPGTIQIPCFVVETSRGNQKQSTRPLVPIQPKKNAEPNAQPAIKPAPPADISPSAVPRFSPPSTTQSSPQEPTVTSSSDQDQLVKAYRAVAGLPKEQLLGQDDDGDTILHLAIVKEKTKLVKALLERYVREELIDKVINLANKQHQTPLCLAVFLNQTEIVKMLIERKADVNVQLQRKLNGGLKCYRLIHYAASRGKKWVPTLIQLLTADNIDLQAFNSEGCTAMHCAIECHGKHYQQGDEKVDSQETIYNLAMRGADLNVQHGLCGKTPLHYAIEKKDSELVGWFLGLASYVQSSSPKQSNANGGRPVDLVHSLLNAKTSAGVTALQLTLGLQMDTTERIPILKMLLRDGAEVSQKGCDGKLRQELAKFPELAGLLKNGTSLTKNGPR